MASENHAAAASAREPRRFFEAQVVGEDPLHHETANQLYQMGGELFAEEPWEFVDDDELILMRDFESGEICYCSIMGALGEVLSLQVYVGTESYRFFRKIVSGKPITPGDFFASVRGVSVEFVTRGDQTPPDRELLQVLGHPKKRGLRGPIFRANRPGYHPWYITEDEGKLLIQCLRGVIAFCRFRLEKMETDDIDFWENEDVFPILVPNPDDKTRYRFEVHPVKAPEPPVVGPRAEVLDDDLVSEILRQDLPQRGALEADHFFTSAKVGEKDERKACLRMALVSDADCGFAFAPETGAPEESSGKLLVRALLRAMRDGRFVPREVRVRQQEFKIALSTLSERLGLDVRVMKSLPAVKQLKDSLFRMMGGSGAFSPR